MDLVVIFLQAALALKDSSPLLPTDPSILAQFTDHYANASIPDRDKLRATSPSFWSVFCRS